MRKYLKIGLLVILPIILGYSTYWIIRGYKEKKATEERIQTLPKVDFFSLTGNLVNLHAYDEPKSLVIIYFHPKCEHCQYEAKEIGQNALAFSNCQLVMITADDSLQRIEKFCAEYNLWEVDNIEILLDKENQFKNTFGKALIPSVYIYDKERKLKKLYLGETKPEAIITLIQEEQEHIPYKF